MRPIRLLLPLLLCALALTACAPDRKPVQDALDFRSELGAAEKCSFTAEVTADCEGRVYRFAMDCSYEPKTGAAALTVTAPETIAGVAARMEGETGALTFDGASLELGRSAGGRVSPMELPRLLGGAWTQAYIDAESPEGDGFLATYRSVYGEGELVVDTVFSADRTPLRCELSADGEKALSAEIKNFTLS